MREEISEENEDRTEDPLHGLPSGPLEPEQVALWCQENRKDDQRDALIRRLAVQAHKNGLEAAKLEASNTRLAKDRDKLAAELFFLNKELTQVRRWVRKIQTCAQALVVSKAEGLSAKDHNYLARFQELIDFIKVVRGLRGFEDCA